MLNFPSPLGEAPDPSVTQESREDHSNTPCSPNSDLPLTSPSPGTSSSTEVDSSSAQLSLTMEGYQCVIVEHLDLGKSLQDHNFARSMLGALSRVMEYIVSTVWKEIFRAIS